MSNENEKNTDLQRIKENNFKGRYAVRADATGGYVVRGDTRYGLRTSQKPGAMQDQFHTPRKNGDKDGSSKKSYSGSRSEKTERLRELTERLKGSVRAPLSKESSQKQTFSFSLNRHLPLYQNNPQMKDMSGCYNVDELKHESNASMTKTKCSRQQSDYGISSTTTCNTKMCSNQSAAVDNVDTSGDREIRESCMSELRELPTLRRTSTRYRSTSFCQVDLHQAYRHKTQPVAHTSNCSEIKHIRANTLPRRRAPSGLMFDSLNCQNPRMLKMSVNKPPVGSVEEMNEFAVDNIETVVLPVDSQKDSHTSSDFSDCEAHVSQKYKKKISRGSSKQTSKTKISQSHTATLTLDMERPSVLQNIKFEESTPNQDQTIPDARKSKEVLTRSTNAAEESDQRILVILELYHTETSYVNTLQILQKYIKRLKEEDEHVIDNQIVDIIFFQIPQLLELHEEFLEKVQNRFTNGLRHTQTVGDIFLEVFTNLKVSEIYCQFLDNWNTAKETIRKYQAEPHFTRFLEKMRKEHSGKLGLDNLLIAPIQRLPRYEMLIQRLLKHTEENHPDFQLLQTAQKEIHKLVVKVDCRERKSFEWEQQQNLLKEIQTLVQGLTNIITTDRVFLRQDLVTIASHPSTRKERALFLFSDLLVIASIKRSSGPIRRTSPTCLQNSQYRTDIKYKMIMQILLNDLEVKKVSDENLKQEVEQLREDCQKLNQLQEITTTIHSPKQQLEEVIKNTLNQIQQLLAEKTAQAQLPSLELVLCTEEGFKTLTVMFDAPSKCMNWEKSFNEAKDKLALLTDKRPRPEFMEPLHIKMRAGLEFTCAASTLTNWQGTGNVWVCNSDNKDGYVCVLGLNPAYYVSPEVISSNGISNSRILCIAGIPAYTPSSNLCFRKKNDVMQDTSANSNEILLDSSSSDNSDSDESIPRSHYSKLDSTNIEADEDANQPMVWLGTEDGCIYMCNSNVIRIQARVKLKYDTSVLCIVYADNKVFVSLLNGNIYVFIRDQTGWNTEPTTVSIGAPVMKMVAVKDKIWCGCNNTVKILNIYTLVIQYTFTASNEPDRAVLYMASSGNFDVWLSLHNSGTIKLYHAMSYECLLDINIVPAANKMLINCDEIIRQHKAACLKVTALIVCGELLWIGTSAGVLLTLPIPHIKSSTQKLSQPVVITGMHHGHTGHVRFIMCYEIPNSSIGRSKVNRYSAKSNKIRSTDVNHKKVVVISGGAGFEDFRVPQTITDQQAGSCKDSKNYLLLWKD
ncbi:rho guanine nucleotide exchange factor 17-like isoform X2 [Pseudomyrmex gracilis]|uniref:rho guanine nucleotide exchange factor 17-like isoform X2 n=1 Tax=Pseudomyrmex gracilis TaxID=219809 RepID=UPI0009955583|nr:rho guanine nucleotide exchange factor 17-like isoform X2 [Pseudomyrmex gracilis]